MSTLREDFERHMSECGRSVGLRDEQGFYIADQVEQRWQSYQAATERATKLADEKAAKSAKMFGKVIHDMIVANQAAWIEWQHGKGAEAAMTWVHNGLAGPGLIPEDDEPYATEPQAWYDANNSDPMPTCFCGRPSNIGWMKQGFCCNEHYETGKAAAIRSGGEAGEPT